jgi:hypothetical protein
MGNVTVGGAAFRGSGKIAVELEPLVVSAETIRFRGPWDWKIIVEELP